MQESDSLDIGRYLDILLRWWWLVLLGPLALGLVAYFYTTGQSQVFRAETTILVNQSQNPLPTRGDIETSQRLADTYRHVITTRPILEEVEQKLAPLHPAGQLKGMVGVTVISGTALLRIDAQNEDPQLAAAIANTLAETFIERTREDRLAEIAQTQLALQAQGFTDSQRTLEAQLSALGSLTIVEPAIVPGAPQSGNLGRNLVLATVLGLLLGVAGAIVLGYLNDTVQSPERIERLFGLSSLGMVFHWRPSDAPSRGTIMTQQPHSSFAESFRHLRANLQFALAGHPGKLLVITSPSQSEGKTTVVANLSVALAHGDLRVIAVDADLRRPELHKYFNLSNEEGVSNFLASPNLRAADLLRDTDTERLRVMPSGPIPPNPSELLGSGRMQSLLNELRDMSDIVLFDSPPAIAVADTSVLASQLDGVVLVTDPQDTRVGSLRSAVQSMQKANVTILGVVLNKFKIRRLYYGYRYRYAYPYYYGHGGRVGNAPAPNGLWPAPLKWAQRTWRNLKRTMRT